MPDILVPGVDFNPGALPYEPRQTDFQWANLGSALLPFDWDKGYDIETELGLKLNQPGFKLPVKNQFQSGSCGGQTSSEMDAASEASFTRTFEERSAKYMIAQTFIVDQQGTMLGSRISDHATILKNQGCAKESVLLSYDAQGRTSDAFLNRPQDITEAARADAKQSKARSYAYVAPNIDLFAQALSNNFGMGMQLEGENNGTWLSAEPKPPTYRQWGHFMFGGKAKLRNGRKAIGALQSWGPNVGEAGWQWFYEDYFASGFMEIGLTIVFDDSIPPPPKYIFTRDLHKGMTGIDVKFLQVWLNSHGFKVALSGLGSPGQETSYFGELTRIAVSKFQQSKGIEPSAGYFGPRTRAAINSI